MFYPVYVALYLDKLTPTRHISLAMQQEIHDPFEVIKSITEFTWAMTKRVIILENS